MFIPTLLEKSRSEDTFIIVDDRVYTFNMFNNLIDSFIQQVAKCNNKINRIENIKLIEFVNIKILKI